MTWWRLQLWLCTLMSDGIFLLIPLELLLSRYLDSSLQLQKWKKVKLCRRTKPRSTIHKVHPKFFTSVINIRGLRFNYPEVGLCRQIKSGSCSYQKLDSIRLFQLKTSRSWLIMSSVFAVYHPRWYCNVWQNSGEGWCHLPRTSLRYHSYMWWFQHYPLGLVNPLK